MKISSTALEELVSSRCRAELLRVLMTAADGQEFTKRELAEALEIPRSSLVPEFQRLERLGVVNGRMVGGALVYRVENNERRAVLRRLVEEFDEPMDAGAQLDLFTR